MSQKLVTEAPDLADSLGIPRQSILRHRAGLASHPLLQGLPEPVMSRPRLVWLTADINAWLESRRTFRPEAAPTDTTSPTEAPRKRGRGRPRKEPRAEGMKKGGVQ